MGVVSGRQSLKVPAMDTAWAPSRWNWRRTIWVCVRWFSLSWPCSVLSLEVQSSPTPAATSVPLEPNESARLRCWGKGPGSALFDMVRGQPKGRIVVELNRNRPARRLAGWPLHGRVAVHSFIATPLARRCGFSPSSRRAGRRCVRRRDCRCARLSGWLPQAVRPARPAP